MIKFILLFLTCAVVRCIVVKQITTSNSVTSGSCYVNPVASMNSNHMNLGDVKIDLFTQLMISGWFKVYPYQKNIGKFN